MAPASNDHETGFGRACAGAVKLRLNVPPSSREGSCSNHSHLPRNAPLSCHRRRRGRRFQDADRPRSAVGRSRRQGRHVDGGQDPCGRRDLGHRERRGGKKEELADNEPAPAGTKLRAHRLQGDLPRCRYHPHDPRYQGGSEAHHSLHVWSRKGGSWKVVATSTTPIASE